jgi:hypothetical protein
MKKEYPDPQQHFDDYMGQARRNYEDGLRKANLDPSPILDRAMSRRTYRSAQEDYEEETAKVLLHNLSENHKAAKPRAIKIRRSNAIARNIICPFAIIVISVCSWYAFGAKDTGDVIAGVIGILGVLLFLAIWVVWDREDKQSKQYDDDFEKILS